MPTLVIAEDDQDDLVLYERAVERCAPALDVQTFRNGRDLWRAVSQGLSASLIILDLNMPLMDGYEFLQQCCQQKIPNLPPVVVITTSTDRRDRERVLNLGAVELLVKPTSFLELMPMLSGLFNTYGLLDPGH